MFIASTSLLSSRQQSASPTLHSFDSLLFLQSLAFGNSKRMLDMLTSGWATLNNISRKMSQMYILSTKEVKIKHQMTPPAISDTTMFLFNPLTKYCCSSILLNCIERSRSALRLNHSSSYFFSLIVLLASLGLGKSFWTYAEKTLRTYPCIHVFTYYVYYKNWFWLELRHLLFSLQLDRATICTEDCEIRTLKTWSVMDAPSTSDVFLRRVSHKATHVLIHLHQRPLGSIWHKDFTK